MSECWFQNLSIDYAAKTFDCILEKPLVVIARWPAGFGLKHWTTSSKGFQVYLLLNPWINCVEVNVLVGLLNMRKLRQAATCFQSSSPRLPSNRYMQWAGCGENNREKSIVLLVQCWSVFNCDDHQVKNVKCNCAGWSSSEKWTWTLNLY